MIRERLVKWLGGYTKEEFEEEQKDYFDTFNEMVRRGDTIKELQALIPVSAVTKKKRGRPKKEKPEVYEYTAKFNNANGRMEDV